MLMAQVMTLLIFSIMLNASDKITRDPLRALVQQLIKRMLGIRANLTP